MVRGPHVLRVAATLVVLVAAGDAAAQSRIVITQFQFDESRRFEDLVADELLFRNEYQLVPFEQFLAEVSDFDVDLEGFLADPGLIVDLAGYFEFDAIVHGALDRRRRPRSLTVTVFDGGSGTAMGSMEFPVERGQVDDQALDRGLLDVVDWIARSRRPGGPTTPAGGSEPVAQSPREQSPRPSFLPEPEPEPEPRPSWMQLRAGLDVVQRNFTITSAEAGIQYDSGFYPGLEGSLEVYPVRAFSPGTLDGLGLRVRLARYFVDTTLVLEDGSLDVPTRHKELGIALLYRHPFGPVELVGSVGYETLAFTLGDNAVYESSRYAGVVISVGGWYAAIARLLRVGIDVEIRPAPSLGDEETAAFGAGDAFGFAVTGGAELTFWQHFSVLGFYRFRQYSNSYDGTGSGDLTGALDATDRYHALGLRLGYAY